MPSLLRCPLAGFGAKTVIVGCHLDSTAGYDVGYDPATDAAPGADDNASGISGTLSVAKFLSHYRGTLKHTVRFCFFNAEEVGIVGSQAYASYLKSTHTAVKAAICMDMIGYNSDSDKIFEVHAGYTDPAVRDISLPIACQIAASASQLGQLGLSQIYKGTHPNSNADRNTYDGAINRSDHASFHQQGYPAVVVSEDFFVNYSSEPPADPNPNYHRQADTIVDSSYGADIACAVAHAAKQLASH
jgi:Zn-dependent M28 family amino/carboxypeptidase